MRSYLISLCSSSKVGGTNPLVVPGFRKLGGSGTLWSPRLLRLWRRLLIILSDHNCNCPGVCECVCRVVGLSIDTNVSSQVNNVRLHHYASSCGRAGVKTSKTTHSVINQSLNARQGLFQTVRSASAETFWHVIITQLYNLQQRCRAVRYSGSCHSNTLGPIVGLASS